MNNSTLWDRSPQYWHMGSVDECKSHCAAANANSDDGDGGGDGGGLGGGGGGSDGGGGDGGGAPRRCAGFTYVKSGEWSCGVGRECLRLFIGPVP